METSARRAAYDALLLFERGAFANLALNDALKALPVNQRGFCTALVYGVIQKKLWLDEVIKRYSKRSAKPAVAVVLRMGAYQLLYMDVPPSAAVNESVKLVKSVGKAALAGFVNGVLRAIARDAKSIAPPEGNDPGALSLRYSWPLWLAERFSRRFGAEGADAFFAACDSMSNDTAVRAVTDEGAAALEGAPQGIVSPEIRYVKGNIAGSAVFKSGGVSAQSEGSALICRMAKRLGGRVLDACAAPGGKTAYLAETAESVVAWDIHPHRVELIKNTCARLGIKNVEARLQDAAQYAPECCGGFDSVLVDAPCSGFGVVPGKPDLKYGKQPEDISKLAELQREILETCSRYVKKGGVLVYSTCTVSKEENEDVAAGFLAEHPEFRADDITPVLPGCIAPERAAGGMLQLLPQVDGVEGFFVCRMVRI